MAALDSSPVFMAKHLIERTGLISSTSCRMDALSQIRLCSLVSGNLSEGFPEFLFLVIHKTTGMAKRKYQREIYYGYAYS